MKGKVFEYFLDPEELEPFYSELPRELLQQRAGDPATRILPAAIAETASEATESVATETETESTVMQPSPERPQVGKVQPAAVDSAPTDLSEQAGEPVGDPSVTHELATHAEPSLPISDSPPTEQPSTGHGRVRRLISVHALGQQEFCVRSAILALEKGDEQEIDEPLPRLTYLPNFDLEQIGEAIAETCRQIVDVAIYLLIALCLTGIGFMSESRYVLYPAAAFIIVFIWLLLGLFGRLLQIRWRWRLAMNAERREPDLEVSSIQQVNWWSILKAGFDLANYNRPFRHPELPLEGCPWRILERGSMRIPVIRAGSSKLGDRTGQLYPKHPIRLAAYALLLESAGHIEVPYGLVFPIDSPRGYAVPITDSLRKRAAESLSELSRKLRESQEDSVEPRLPEQRSRCKNCKYGHPIPNEQREIESARRSGARLLVLTQDSGRTFHCECGDRFGSAPPHGRSIKIGLTAVLD